MINKTAVERGFFWSTTYKTHSDCEKKEGYSSEIIGLPPLNSRRNDANYGFLDKNGVIKKRHPNGENVYVQKGDVIIGKILVQADKDGSENITDVSLVIKNGEEGYIDRVINETTSGGYKLIKVVIRKLKEPEIGDKFACYDSKTEVLTTTGWKFISNLTWTTRVATLENGRLEYRYPTDLQRYNAPEKMYSIKTQDVDLVTTLNHNLYVKTDMDVEFELHQARDMLGVKCNYQKHAYFVPTVESLIFMVLPGDYIPIYVYIPLFVALYFGMRGDLSEIPAYYIQSNATVFDLIKSFTTQWAYTLTSIVVYDKRLLSEIKYQIGLPNWVWSLSRENARLLVECIYTYQKGDGDVFSIRDMFIKDDMQRLALHAGWCITVKTKRDRYQLEIIKKESRNTPMVNNGVKEDKIVKGYCGKGGKVYCCSVPSGVIYIRRNGKTVWCGNSRSAQKGTCGMMYSQEDMPFTSEGIVPDIIMNPHAIPSRMTANQLMESVLGKSCLIEGNFGDGTAFSNCKNEEKTLAEEICERLGMNNYKGNGVEKIYNGMTGEYMGECFIGPVYYQRLKHLVSEKIHARATGPVTSFFRQALEGRRVQRYVFIYFFQICQYVV